MKDALREEVEKITNDPKWFGTPCARAIRAALESKVLTERKKHATMVL